MNNKTLALIISSTLLLAACGNNSASNNTAPSENTASSGKGDISASRTAAFKSFMPTMSTMGKMAKGDQAFDPNEFKRLAEQFSKEAREPFEHFQSDPKGNGDALPAIWEKPAEFKAEQDKFFAAVDKLNATAQTGQLDAIKAAVGEVGASCKSCHDSYRRPK